MLATGLDTGAVARALAAVADRSGDLADAFFERLEEVELAGERREPGLLARREEGLAVRLVRGGQSWLASRDGIAPRAFAAALRQVARALPPAAPPEPRLDPEPMAWPWETAELAAWPACLSRRIRAHHAAFPLRLTLRRHRRWLQVVGTTLTAEPQSELFFSYRAEAPWGVFGGLLPALDEAAAERLAEGLVGAFRAREAPPPPPARLLVLGPAAAAVLLHEVAHALEADTLALSGRPAAARGLRLAASGVALLDDPASAPAGVRRTADDEGIPVARRWLLRDGVVEEPLADLVAAQASGELVPGAGRRGSRHQAPRPRSTHLELLAGEASLDELLARAEGGLLLPQASRGWLDPLSGRCVLQLPFGRVIRGGAPAEWTGACRLEGAVGELLSSIAAVGSDTEPAGAGWCAKTGARLPVWASTPALLLEGLPAVSG